MGILVHGICHSCDRSGRIVDTENNWCQKCAEDPKYRKICDKKFFITCMIWLAFFVVVAYVARCK